MPTQRAPATGHPLPTAVTPASRDGRRRRGDVPDDHLARQGGATSNLRSLTACLAARRIIEFGTTVDDFGPRQFGSARAAGPRATPHRLAHGFAPTPAPLDEEPSPVDPLPRADYVVITWTAAEMLALADVLTPGSTPAGAGTATSATSTATFRTSAGERRPASPVAWAATTRPASATAASCASRSELHLNQDGVAHRPGKATLPVADLFRQIIAEARPQGRHHGRHRPAAPSPPISSATWSITRACQVPAHPRVRATSPSPASLPQRHPHPEEAPRYRHPPDGHLDRSPPEPDFGPPSKLYPTPRAR